MLIKPKHSKNFKQPKKSKRKLYTQPLNFSEQQEQQKAAVNAKNYLIQLNKDEDGQFQPFLIQQKSKQDITLSQWGNLQKNGCKLSERFRFPKSMSIQVNKIGQRKISSKQLSPIEISLIDQQASRIQSPLRLTNLSQFIKYNDSIKANHSPQQIKIKKLSSNIQPFQANLKSKSRVISIIAKKQKINKIDCTSKIDISYVQKSSLESNNIKKRQQQIQNRNKLPRLDHIQSQQYKNKYKSIFQVNNRKNILLVPMHSPISKDLCKIDDLIREESIKLLKKHI